LGRRKAGNLTAARPDVIATANAGCLLQIRRYLDEGIPLVHPVQLVDASIRGTDPFGKGARDGRGAAPGAGGGVGRSAAPARVGPGGRAPPGPDTGPAARRGAEKGRPGP